MLPDKATLTIGQLFEELRHAMENQDVPPEAPVWFFDDRDVAPIEVYIARHRTGDQIRIRTPNGHALKEALLKIRDIQPNWGDAAEPRDGRLVWHEVATRISEIARAALRGEHPDTESPAMTESAIDEKIGSVAVDIHADLQQRKHLRIGVFDYESCVRCLTSAFQAVFPDLDQQTDPQNMIQLLGAEISRLRMQIEDARILAEYEAIRRQEQTR